MVKRVGQRLRACRQRLSWSVDYLAQRAGVAQNTISTLERGTRRAQWRVLVKVAKALNVSVQQLADPETPAFGDHLDPHLRGLTTEDLKIAKQYHDAPTRVRQTVQSLLKQANSAAAATAVATAEARRLAQLLTQLSPDDLQTVAALITKFVSPTVGLPQTHRHARENRV